MDRHNSYKWVSFRSALTTIRDLERVFLPSFKAIEDLSIEEYYRFTASDEYRAFEEVCLNGGFVCDDYDEFFNLALIHALPEEIIPNLTLSGIRHYIHTVQRAEKWNSEYSRALFDAVKSGSLGLVWRRLQSVQRNVSAN